MKKVYGIVTGLALALGVMTGVVSAEEQFSMLKGIPAKAMSTDEMEAIQGRQWNPLAYYSGGAIQYGFFYSLMGAGGGARSWLYPVERKFVNQTHRNLKNNSFQNFASNLCRMGTMMGGCW